MIVIFDENIHTIVDMIEKQAIKKPHQAAVKFGEVIITYEELNRKANQKAYSLLQKLKCQRESFVGLIMNRSIDLAVAMLGILKSGSTYVPIDPKLPKERIKSIVDDANLSLIITDDQIRLSLKRLCRNVVPI
ncbi:AMP-binding protein [Paenactinomyces guangxiensis]|uniref:AMP-binding protein n=1 Tax=Paenactinomyces guangxiensis TaxID=1490290 RepID=A0A7W2A9S2_9BACL|nr:AMP-binding protein [Paenactinomyces guangxiensis]MBA4495183.1 AMP-binding protein [Paenactinomyces guangxiensis]MBH8592133.1 AMP-binding protein [Paenactinomyces guangxiensis]